MVGLSFWLVGTKLFGEGKNNGKIFLRNRSDASGALMEKPQAGL
jgi:hypothetical protein